MREFEYILEVFDGAGGRVLSKVVLYFVEDDGLIGFGFLFFHNDKI